MRNTEHDDERRRCLICPPGLILQF